ncbi:hypothetical protein [Roseibium album]|uniref:hypothetical protein n=1 Tax=Roseibium album TaxID=311410 RepID=UPI0024939FD6|nr:hypothetical protein [Roseibium album]
MFNRLITFASILMLCSGVAHAIPVNPGDTIRGSYAFPTYGATELEPTSFLLRLFSADLFGGADAVGTRILDEGLNPLLFTTLNASGTALDPTIGIPVKSLGFPSGCTWTKRPGKDTPHRLRRCYRPCGII